MTMFTSPYYAKIYHSEPSVKWEFRDSIFKESIPRNRFRQPMYPGGPVRQPYTYSAPSIIDCYKKSCTGVRKEKRLGTGPRRENDTGVQLGCASFAYILLGM